MVETTAWSAAETFALGAATADDIPIQFVGPDGSDGPDGIGTLDAAQKAWLSAQKFSEAPSERSHSERRGKDRCRRIRDR